MQQVGRICNLILIISLGANVFPYEDMITSFQFKANNFVLRVTPLSFKSKSMASCQRDRHSCFE